MKFKDRKEQRKTNEIMCALLSPFKDYLTEEKRKAVELTLRILQDTDIEAANMERSSQYYNGGWISVKDKLPEDFNDVLVWYEYFRYGDYNRMVQTYGIGCYISNLGAWSGDPGTGTMAKVIAWQPLPTPPESEGKE